MGESIMAETVLKIIVIFLPITWSQRQKGLGDLGVTSVRVDDISTVHYIMETLNTPYALQCCSEERPVGKLLSCGPGNKCSSSSCPPEATNATILNTEKKGQSGKIRTQKNNCDPDNFRLPPKQTGQNQVCKRDTDCTGCISVSGIPCKNWLSSFCNKPYVTNNGENCPALYGSLGPYCLDFCCNCNPIFSNCKCDCCKCLKVGGACNGACPGYECP